MDGLYYLSLYKNKIINLLLKNEDFIKLIAPQTPKHEELDIIDTLVGGEWIIDGVKHVEQGHIFDHDFVEDTIKDKKTFVFVEADIENIDRNTFFDFVLFICFFTPKELVRITKQSNPTIDDVKDMGYFVGNTGNRIDILCDIIHRTINGNENIRGIGDVKPYNFGFCTRYYPTPKYYGKCLKYTIKNLCVSDLTCEDM